jgi:hypothetical protein
MIPQATSNDEIKFIHSLITDRMTKNQATYFSVKANHATKISVLVNKQIGTSFYETIIQYLMYSDLTYMQIELFDTNTLEYTKPLQTFNISLERNTQTSPDSLQASLVNEVNKKTNITTQTLETNFAKAFEHQRQLLMIEYENQNMKAEILALKKKCKKHKQTIKHIEKSKLNSEQTKHDSLSTVSLGAAGAKALEGFAKSEIGIGLLTNLLKTDSQTLTNILGVSTQSNTAKSNLLNDTKTESKTEIQAERKTELKTDKPLTKQEICRLECLTSIQTFFEGIDPKAFYLYLQVISRISENEQNLNKVCLFLDGQSFSTLETNKTENISTITKTSTVNTLITTETEQQERKPSTKKVKKVEPKKSIETRTFEMSEVEITNYETSLTTTLIREDVVKSDSVFEQAPIEQILSLETVKNTRDTLPKVSTRKRQKKQNRFIKTNHLIKPMYSLYKNYLKANRVFVTLNFFVANTIKEHPPP